MENTGYMTVDGLPVEIHGEKSILELLNNAGIELPVFCNHLEVSLYGHCRLCMVETDEGILEFACSIEPRDGMNIKTKTDQLQSYRRNILKLMLANPVPDRLRELAEWMGLAEYAAGVTGAYGPSP
jgi:NADH-quinone oxidoreductase subunit G